MKKFISLLLISAISAFALNINTTTKAELIKVKGIGAKKAERIIAYRDKHGKFNSIDELKNVKGIGSKNDSMSVSIELIKYLLRLLDCRS